MKNLILSLSKIQNKKHNELQRTRTFHLKYSIFKP